jgi:hypothetical protein
MARDVLNFLQFTKRHMVLSYDLELSLLVTPNNLLNKSHFAASADSLEIVLEG